VYGIKKLKKRLTSTDLGPYRERGVLSKAGIPLLSLSILQYTVDKTIKKRITLKIRISLILYHKMVTKLGDILTQE
jgi:hypothetical protein